MPGPVDPRILDYYRQHNPMIAGWLLSGTGNLPDEVFRNLPAPPPEVFQQPPEVFQPPSQAALDDDARAAAEALGTTPPRNLLGLVPPPRAAADDSRYGPEGGRYGPDMPQLPRHPDYGGMPAEPPSITPRAAAGAAGAGIPSTQPPRLAGLEPDLPPGLPPDAGIDLDWGGPRPRPRPQADLSTYPGSPSAVVSSSSGALPEADDVDDDADQAVQDLSDNDRSRSTGNGPMGWLDRFATGVKDIRADALDTLGIEDSEAGSGRLGRALIRGGASLMAGSADFGTAMGQAVGAGLDEWTAEGKSQRDERLDAHRLRMDEAELGIKEQELELSRERVAQAQERLRRSAGLGDAVGTGAGYPRALVQVQSYADSLMEADPSLTREEAWEQALVATQAAAAATYGRNPPDPFGADETTPGLGF